MLRAALGEAAAAHLHELAWGRDPRRVTPEHVEKSIGAEITFDTDVADPTVIRRALLALAEQGRRAGCAGPARSAARSSIKVRLADFRTRQPLPHPGRPDRRGPGDLRHRLGAVRGARPPASRIRLVGVRVEGLAGAGATPRQLDPRRAGARLARGGSGRRRRGCPVRAVCRQVRPAFSGLARSDLEGVAGRKIRRRAVRSSRFPTRRPPRRLAGKQPFGCHGLSARAGPTDATGEECRAALGARAAAVRADRAVACRGPQVRLGCARQRPAFPRAASAARRRRRDHRWPGTGRLRRGEQDSAARRGGFRRHAGRGCVRDAVAPPGAVARPARGRRHGEPPHPGAPARSFSTASRSAGVSARRATADVRPRSRSARDAAPDRRRVAVRRIAASARTAR